MCLLLSSIGCDSCFLTGFESRKSSSPVVDPCSALGGSLLQPCDMGAAQHRHSLAGNQTSLASLSVIQVGRTKGVGKLDYRWS